MSEIIGENNKWTEKGFRLDQLMRDQLQSIRDLPSFKGLDTVDFTFLVTGALQDNMNIERLDWREND